MFLAEFTDAEVLCLIEKRPDVRNWWVLKWGGSADIDMKRKAVESWYNTFGSTLGPVEGWGSKAALFEMAGCKGVMAPTTGAASPAGFDIGKWVSDNKMLVIGGVAAWVLLSGGKRRRGIF